MVPVSSCDYPATLPWGGTSGPCVFLWLHCHTPLGWYKWSLCLLLATLPHSPGVVQVVPNCVTLPWGGTSGPCVFWLPCHTPLVLWLTAGTGSPGAGVLRPGGVASKLCHVYFSVAARRSFWAQRSLRFFLRAAGT